MQQIKFFAAVVLVGLMVPSASAAAGAEQAAAPAPAAAESAIPQLIRQLGAADYFLRQQAQNDLMKLGFKAFDALSEATSSEDLEISSRAKYLLKLIRVEWVDENDPPEVKKQLHDYEQKDVDVRAQRMHMLAVLSETAGVTALTRLVRFEQSVELSKRAAIEIIGQKRAGEPPTEKVVKIVRSSLEGCRRPAAQWLLAFALFHDDPNQALAEWAKICAAEEVVFRRAPGETDQFIVVTLLRFEINWLERLHRNAEAVAAMRRLIELEKGDPETLVELVDWLLEQKEWKVIDEVGGRFAARFDGQPLLLYPLAAAQQALGQKDKLEATLKRARQATPRGTDEPLLWRIEIVAAKLAEHGLFEWAEQEYRDAIAKVRPNSEVGLEARFYLSEMLHDQGQELKAAKAAEEACQILGPDRSPDEEVVRRPIREWRSRMHFFFACEHEKQGDRAKYRKALDDALAADPSDVDVLIACYRLPEATPEFRTKIRDLIKKAAVEMRTKIAEDPELASLPANQFAWLIGNTEGDFEEAIKLSKQSIEMRPDAGGYYDTLARCYYAKGDYESAVKYQSKALELDPHSGLIARQLALFRKALDEKAKR